MWIHKWIKGWDIITCTSWCKFWWMVLIWLLLSAELLFFSLDFTFPKYRNNRKWVNTTKTLVSFCTSSQSPHWDVMVPSPPITVRRGSEWRCDTWKSVWSWAGVTLTAPAGHKHGAQCQQQVDGQRQLVEEQSSQRDHHHHQFQSPCPQQGQWWWAKASEWRGVGTASRAEPETRGTEGVWCSKKEVVWILVSSKRWNLILWSTDSGAKSRAQASLTMETVGSFLNSTGPWLIDWFIDWYIYFEYKAISYS